MIAAAKGVDASEVAAAVEACGGPAIGAATTPDAVRFFDDARRGRGAAVGGERDTNG